MAVSTKSGNLQLTELDVPGSVKPGDSVTFTTSVQNNALNITLLDNDHCAKTANPCDQGRTDAAGYCYTVQFRFDSGDTIDSGPHCIGIFAGTQHPETSLNELPDQDGDYPVQARLKMNGSGEVSDWMDTTLTISEDDPVETDPPDDGDDNGDTPDPTDPVDQINQIMRLGVLGVGAYAIAQVAGAAEGATDVVDQPPADEDGEDE